MRDLNELQIFVQVAQTQSFTTAAERLGLPKSSVSRAIRNLEVRLGIRLIERTTRRVALSEEGRIYFDRCERVLEDAEQADLEIGALQAKPRGTLRVGTPGIFARHILGPALGEFLALYPEVRVHLQSLDAISRERPLDVVVRAGPLDDSGFLVKPLLQIRLAIYASPSYLKHHSMPDSPAELREHSCIITNCDGFTDANRATIWRLRRGAEPLPGRHAASGGPASFTHAATRPYSASGEMKEVRVEPRVSVPDPAISQQLALAGAGVALFSQAAARRDVEQGRLIRLLPDWEPDPVELYALYASRLSSSPKVRAFVQFLKGRFTGDSFRDLGRVFSGATATPSPSRAKVVNRAS